jgi:hypothetical protein
VWSCAHAVLGQCLRTALAFVLVILGGISICFPTYFMVSTGKSLSRKCLQNDGAFKHRHTQASVKAG